MAKLIDGKAHAERIRGEVKEKIRHLKTSPGLAVVLVGDDPASLVYIRNKKMPAKKRESISVCTTCPKRQISTQSKKESQP